jgi:hypothetical protein
MQPIETVEQLEHIPFLKIVPSGHKVQTVDPMQLRHPVM